MTILSRDQIRQYAADAGFVGADLEIAVAIALAESSGNVEAHGDTSLGSGAGSVGLWQIYLDAHPEFAHVDLYDPLQNAIAAHQIYLNAKRSFRPWSTYKSNAYLAFLTPGAADEKA